MSIFEAGMLICFGASWPFAIAKIIKTKSAKGVSLLFLSLILAGYICGMINKYINKPDMVMLLYVYNALLVIIQMVLYFVYQDKALKEAK